MLRFHGLCCEKSVLTGALQDFSACRERHDLPGNHLSAVLECRDRCIRQSTATGNFHANDQYAGDIVLAENLRQFLGIISFIELRTTDDRDTILHEGVMEFAMCVSSAIGGNQEVRAVQIGRANRKELYLDRPLEKLGSILFLRDRSIVGHGNRPRRYGSCVGGCAAKCSRS